MKHSIVTLEIDNRATSFSTVWVHLKYERRLNPVLFRVSIARSHIRTIFDPYDTKPETESWPAFINEQIRSLGTFIVEGYFKTMARIAGNEKKAYEWVIARIDNIIEDTDNLIITGQAEPFDPAMF